MNAPLSYTEARCCWICGAFKTVVRTVQGFPHRMCERCDAPEHVDRRKATWQQEAS